MVSLFNESHIVCGPGLKCTVQSEKNLSNVTNNDKQQFLPSIITADSLAKRIISVHFVDVLDTIENIDKILYNMFFFF